MPLREIAGTDFRYFLIAFDEEGVERTEADGSRMSDTIHRRVEEDGVTDVFFTSHGWKGDIPAAIEQYDRWVAAMASLDADRAAIRARRPDFKPLVVGLHWPSLPWGDESFEESTPGVLGVAQDLDREVETYAKRIADTPLARQAIRRILVAARTSSQLTRQMQDDYATLFAEAKLGGEGTADVEREGFDPAAIIEEYKATEPASQEQTQVLGWTDKVKDAVLSPLRQLSFWKMKDRARLFGESGAHELLVALQNAAPAARFHLMGHSFGCIVVSATVAGGARSTPLPRPVDSLFLVQGALSLWSYADDVPYARGTPGYFNRIVRQRLVRGPIVTTRSKFDTAVGRFYPMGAKLKSQLTLRGEKFPKYGGVGSFGLQGIAVEDGEMGSAAFAYGFRNGAVYNLESSGVIKDGEGASGAHSDIAHAEVAHAFWAAVMAKEGATRGGGFLGGTLRAEPQAPPPPMTEATPETMQVPEIQPAMAEPPAARYINAEVEDHVKEAPLKTGEWYVVAFDVDTTPREQSVGAVRFQEQQLFERKDEIVELTVQLASSDFDIQEPTRRLRVPRAGKSQGKARFDVSPRHDGRASLTATFHKQGNFVQQMDVAFSVGTAMGAVPQTMSRGRSPAAANVLFPREVGLSIEPGVGGYDCVVWGPVAAKAKLPLQAAELAAAIDVAREELMKVVYQNAGGKLVFQQGIDVPEADRDAALKVMARAGRQLFQKLFFGPAAGADSRKVGEYLQTMASDANARLHVQIVANSVPVPWGLLYLGEVAGGAQLDWDNFLGMRHVIEVIPLQTELRVTQSDIPSDKPTLAVSLNLNESIDAQMGAKFVADQKAFWDKAAQSRRRMRVTGRSKSTELAKALGTAGTEDQILYFYCHAASTGLADPGGTDASSLVLTDAPITLGDLSLDAPTSIQLNGSPLVFINACESGKMSPTFYDGFVPYFMAKGARGVVGTECETPAMFAAAWAQRFFERFLDGEPLGEAFLNLRREFLLEHNNPLGLMYAVHCDGDTRIQPALTA